MHDGIGREGEERDKDLYFDPHDKEMLMSALAGVAQWIECQTVDQRVASLIPS